MMLAAAMWSLAGAALAEAPAVEGAPAENSAVAQNAGPDFADIERFVDGYVAAAQSEHYPPGVIIAVATREGEFVKGYGVESMETGAPTTADSLFRIASVSKTFVWVSVMMLADEGKLDLDADVNTYLKNIRIPETFGKPVTLNDLMAHRAGFEDTLGDFFESRSGRSFEDALINQMPKRVAPPGARTSYSNWGTDLAAHVVAKVSGVAFDDFVRARILTPLGMTSTALRDPQSAAGKPLNDPKLDARIAAPHKYDAGAATVMKHDATEPLYAAGAVSLSARDAARWIRFLLNEGAAGDQRLLSREAFALMRTRHFKDRPDAPDFAHGFMESEIAGRKTYGHGGTLSGFITDLTIVPDLGIGVLVSVNGAEDGIRLSDLLARAVIEDFAGKAPYATKWDGKGDVEAAKALAGTYAGARRVQSKFEKASSLGGDIAIAAKDDGTIAFTAGTRTKRYYPVSKDRWIDRAEDSLFVYRDDKGAPVAFSYAMGTDTAIRTGFFDSSMGVSAGLNAALFFSLTAFLGLWRRLGREDRTTTVGRGIAIAHLGSAALWLVFAGLLVAASLGVGAMELAELQEKGWPPQALVWGRYGAHVVAFGAALAGVLLIPAITRSGWSIWRKIHFALFALAGLCAAVMLWQWRLILAPMTNV
jgi:CubicO group peptidase (beta-lactamase class C family)